MGRDMLRLQRVVLQSWLRTCNHQTIPGINRRSHCCHRQHHRSLHQPADYGSLHHHCQLRSKRTHLIYRISSVRCSNSVWTTTAASKTHRRGNADDPIPPQHPPRRFSSGGDRSVSDNPLLDLQRFVAVPLLAAGDVVFTPCREDVAKGCSLFVPGAKHQIRFLQGAYSPEQAPRYKLPEVSTFLDLHLSTRVYKQLSPPLLVLRLDLNEPLQPDSGELPSFVRQERTSEFEASDEGRITAVPYWYDIGLDAANRVNTLDGETHWRQAAHLLSQPLEVEKGQRVRVRVRIEESSFRFDVEVLR